jgi:hypothetical protein
VEVRRVQRTTRNRRRQAFHGEKRREWTGMARDPLPRVREKVQWRFDAVSIYCEAPETVNIELFKNAFPVS